MQNLRNKILNFQFCLFLFVVFFTFQALTENNSKSRIDELFLWKTSEELKLNLNEEKKFREIYFNQLQEKHKANEKMEGLLNSSDKKENSAKQIQDYKQLLSQITQSENAEIESYQKLLGDERLWQYLQFRHRFLTSLKNLSQKNFFQQEESSSKKEVKSKPYKPKVIEEK